MFDNFKNKRKLYIADFNSRRIIIQKYQIFIKDISRE